MQIAEIGKLVEKRRADLQLKQEDLAELAGVTIKTIYQLETGKGNPSFSTLEKVLSVLGLTLNVEIKKLIE